MFDPKCVERVNKILEETGAQLVVSSSWRNMQDLPEIFEAVGLPYDFQVTPYGDIIFGTFLLDIPDYDRKFCRGDEIKYWIDHRDPNARYVIIDDDPDMLEEQLPYFIQTCGDKLVTPKLYAYNKGSGLTEECVKKAIQILNNGTSTTIYKG